MSQQLAPCLSDSYSSVAEHLLSMLEAMGLSYGTLQICGPAQALHTLDKSGPVLPITTVPEFIVLTPPVYPTLFPNYFFFF